MAISIDWATYTINIPRADMLLLQTTPIEVRQLDVSTFHDILRDIEDDEVGIIYPVTHNYAASTPISGVVLAQVMEILDPYTITFEDGQYAVNVVGGNTNIADKININNVGVRTANSAGLQDLSSLQAASFSDGSVAVNIESQYSGTIFPIGTRGYPINNMADAEQIVQLRGFNTFRILKSMTITGDDLSEGYVIQGDNPSTVMITLADSADTSNATFENCMLTGIFDGNNFFRNCSINNATYVSGFIFQCALTGTISLAPNSQLSLLDCYSNVAGGGTPILDFDNQTAVSVAIRNYAGGLRLINLTDGTDKLSIDLNSGRLYIDASCTAGTIIIRGVGEVIDESISGVTIINETINTAIDNIPTTVWEYTA